MTKSQERAVERIHYQLDRRLKGKEYLTLALFEVSEENERCIYVHWIIHPTFTDDYNLLSDEAMVRIGKRGSAFYNTSGGYRPYRYDVQSMTAAEQAWKDL